MYHSETRRRARPQRASQHIARLRSRARQGYRGRPWLAPRARASSCEALRGRSGFLARRRLLSATLSHVARMIQEIAQLTIFASFDLASEFPPPSARCPPALSGSCLPGWYPFSTGEPFRELETREKCRLSGARSAEPQRRQRRDARGRVVGWRPPVPVSRRLVGEERSNR